MKKYYMAINGEQLGPFELGELLGAGLTQSTLVWCEGMPQWQPASQIPELARLFPPSIASVPSPVQPKPDCWLGWAVAATIIGFTMCGIIPGVFGILGIVGANESESLWRAGRYVEAEARAVSARRWVKVSGIVMLVEFILCLLFFFIFVVTLMGSSISSC